MQNKVFKHHYSTSLAQLFARFSNTNLVLKIILMDSQGDFYQLYTKLWTLRFDDSPYFEPFPSFIENCSRSCQNPSDINQGFYFSVDKRIVQVSYEDYTLYKTAAIPESEFLERKQYYLSQIDLYQKKLNT
jgi:hypothetical protein